MPQLNPEFFLSQVFWLIITFSFLFIFLWRISLPRINSVLEKRSNKINNDIKEAKKLQTEAEEIEKKINIKLQKAKSETSDLIKSATSNFQNHSTKELEKVDQELNIKLEKSSALIEKNKKESLNEINVEIYDIAKLIIQKISNIKVDNSEIKKTADNIKEKAVH